MRAHLLFTALLSLAGCDSRCAATVAVLTRDGSYQSNRATCDRGAVPQITLMGSDVVVTCLCSAAPSPTQDAPR